MACAATAVLSLAATAALAQNTPPIVEIPSTTQPAIGEFGFDMTGMDTSVRPGNDFNRYANGRWSDITPIPADRTSFGAFHVLHDRSQENLKTLIEESAANPSSSADAGRIGAFYNSFMDEAAVERLGASPLQADLAEVRAADTREEIAALMERTPSFSKSQLARGGRRLRALLEPESLTPAPLAEAAHA